MKGVAWDPTGTFLASQGERSVIVWRVADAAIERTITRPYKKSADNTIWKRLSWTPDGQFLATSGGLKNAKHVAPIIQRNDWTADKDFVGHVAPIVSAVRFLPSFFPLVCRH